MAAAHGNLPNSRINAKSPKSALRSQNTQKSSKSGLRRRVSFSDIADPEIPEDPAISAALEQVEKELAENYTKSPGDEQRAAELYALELESAHQALEEDELDTAVNYIKAESESTEEEIPHEPPPEKVQPPQQTAPAPEEPDPTDLYNELEELLAADSPDATGPDAAEPAPSITRLNTVATTQPPKKSLVLKVLGSFLDFGKTTGTGIYNGSIWVKKHPMIFFIALLTAAPNALFAFTSHPEKLREVLAKLSKSKLTFSILRAISSLGINAILNAYFLTTAWTKIKPIVTHILDGPKEFAEGLAVLTLAAAAALGAAALAYNSFQWLPLASVLATVPAAVSLSVNFASRLVGVKNAFTRLRNMTSMDAKVQLDLADKLKHINISNAEYKKLFDDGFDDIKTTLFANRNADEVLKDSDFETVEIRLAQLISDHNETYQLYLRESSNKEIALRYIKLSMQLFYGSAALLFFAMPYALTYLQKGRDGIHILMQLIGKIFGVNWGLDNLPQLVQIAMGVPSGIATFMLAGGALMDTPQTTVKIINHLSQNPGDIPKAALLLGANAISAFGPANTATSVIDNEHNNLNLKAGLLGTLFISANTVTGFDINARYTGEKSLLDPEITTSELKLDHVLGRLEDPVAHRICEATTRQIQATSLFAKRAPAVHEGNHDLNRIQSAPGV